MEENENENDNPFNLLQSKATIDFSKLTPFFIANVEVKKVVLEENIRNCRKASMKSEINFSVQKYFYNQADQLFVLLNPEHRNVMKRTPLNMKQDDSVLKAVLLELASDKSVLFILPRALCETEFTEAVKRLKIPLNSLPSFEDCIYYKIDVKQIFIEMPPEPESFADYPHHIALFQEEVRYLLKEKHYSYAEKCANTIISRIFAMRKDKKALLDEETKLQLYNQMKPIMLNKTLCITLREGDYIQKWNRYEEAMECIEKEYYSHFSNDCDEYYLKITGRYSMYAYKTRHYDKAYKALEDLKQKFDSSNEIIIQLEKEMQLNHRVKKTTEPLEKKLSKCLVKKDDHSKDEEDLGLLVTQKDREEDDEYEWEVASLDISDYLKTDTMAPGVAHILSNAIIK